MGFRPIHLDRTAHAANIPRHDGPDFGYDGWGAGASRANYQPGLLRGAGTAFMRVSGA